MAKTLYDKLWDAHVVRENEDGTCLLYIDRPRRLGNVYLQTGLFTIRARATGDTSSAAPWIASTGTAMLSAAGGSICASVAART